MEIRADIDVQALAATMDAAARKQLPFALALSLTMTAQDIKAAERAEMQRVFDRPTPYALNSLFVRPAKKNDLVAFVWLRPGSANAEDSAEGYLGPQIFGGPRKAKVSERNLRSVGQIGTGKFLVPAARAPLDKYGNVSRGQIQRLLSDLRAQRDPLRNITDPNKQKYFIAGDGKSVLLKKGKSKEIAFLIVNRAPTYQKRFDFYGVANRVKAQKFPDNFTAAWNRAMATAGGSSASTFNINPNFNTTRRTP